MAKRKSFLLRIDPALYQALEEWAQQELRSVNGQIEYLLKQAATKHRRAVKEETEPPKDSQSSE